MSRLDELIQEYCPDGVEYKKLKDIAETFVGLATSVTKWKKDNGILLLHNSDIKENRIEIKKIEFLDEKFVNKNKNKVLKRNDIITVHTGDVGTSAVIEKQYEGTIGFTTLTSRIKDFNKVDPYYLSYCLNSQVIKSQISKMTISDRNNLNQSSYDELVIPLPALPVQREIVRILDEFTAKTAELQAELNKEYEARKKQYEYYRDELLCSNTEIPRVKLKDIATEMFRGSGIKRDQVTENGIPCIRYGEIYTTYNTWFKDCMSHTNLELIDSPKYFNYGDILFAITGESVEDIAKSIAYIGNERCLAGGDIVVMKHKQNPRYLAHVLSTTMAKEQKSKGKVKSKVVHSNVSSIENIEIPLPSLEQQEYLANVLDNFETICNNIYTGLPAEIEARQKQYEYYRDKLLTFKELK